MKVLHLSSEKTWRGGEQQIAYLIEELEKQGVENFVACRKKSSFENYCIKNNINHISLPFANNFDILTAWQIKNFVNYADIEIIHMHSSRSHTLAVIASAFGSKAKMILSRRVDFPSAGNWLSKYKYNHPKIKKVLCVSEKIKEIISPIINNKSKLEVVYSGIDIKRFEGKTKSNILHKEFKLDPDTKIVANISALAPHKDYFTFVDTVKEFIKISNLKVKFFAIGEGNCRTEIENYIKQKGLENNIFLTGFRNDIPEIFPELDLFLITSEEEGLGTTVLDAIANKVPIVATAGGGIPEMIKHNLTGLLYPIKTPKELAKGLKVVLEKPKEAALRAKNAYGMLLEKFTKENTAKQTLKVYKKYC